MPVRPFALDLARPLSTARGEMERREGFLLGLALDGHRGVGEATPLPGWTESLDACRAALDAVDDAAAEAVATTHSPSGGGDDAPPVRFDDGLADRLADTPAARHALELAALDALARRAERPLSALLADRASLPAPAETVPVNATVGDATPADTVAAARDAVDAGFACLKCKVGAGALDRDVERLRAVRDAVGPDVGLRADANAAWDRETALAAVEAFEPLGLDILEQPLPPSDLSGHADLRGRGVDIAVDESLAAVTVDEVLAAGAADAVVLKPMVLGGPARALAAAVQARAAGVDTVVTTTVDAAPARTAAVHVAAAIPDVSPCGLATAGLLADDLAPDPAPVVDGAVRLPTRPGNAADAFDGLVA